MGGRANSPRIADRIAGMLGCGGGVEEAVGGHSHRRVSGVPGGRLWWVD